MVIWEKLLDEKDNLKAKVTFSPKKSLSDIDHLSFHQEFPNTFEYTFFFLKALEGFLEIKYDIHKVKLDAKQTITFEIENTSEKDILITKSDWLRMDLVARLAGRIVEDIKRIQNQVVIVYDINKLECDGQSVYLDFITADFVKGKAKKGYGFVKQNGNNLIWEIAEPTDMNSVKHFRIQSKRENEDIDLDFFGWRSAGRRSFDDIPISHKSNQKFATYLCFPVFFQYEPTNLIFLCTKKKSIKDDFKKFYDAGGKNDLNIKHFNDISVESYVKYKQDYAKSNLKSGYLGSLQICLGVARHNSIHFEIEEEAGELFGVFFQVDIYSNHKKINLQGIYESQIALRPRLKYKILQLLATESIAELDLKIKELQKKDQMLSLLLAPLDRLSEALQQTQQDTQELRSILYSPARGLFAAAPNVWKYFEDGKKIPVGTLIIETCHNVPTSEDSAKQLLAGIVLEILGKRVSINPSGWKELFGIIDDALVENNKATEELRELCIRLLGLQSQSFEQLKKPQEIFDEFKKILFKPYKKLSGKYTLHTFNILSKKLTVNETTWKQKNKKYMFYLPCPQLSNFLEFLSGVIEFASNNSRFTSIDIAESNGNVNNVCLEFLEKENMHAVGIDISQDSKLQDIFNDLFLEMEEIITQGLRRITSRTAGDLSKPFIEFASACYKAEVEKLETKDGIKIISKMSSKIMIIRFEAAYCPDQTINKLNCCWEDKKNA